MAFPASHNAAESKQRFIIYEFTLLKMGIKIQATAVATIQINVIRLSCPGVNILVTEGSPAF